MTCTKWIRPRELTVAATLAMAAILALFLPGTSRSEELQGYTGRQLYDRFCASCHGERGLGDGPVAPFFRLDVPDLTRIARRRGGIFPAEDVRRIIDGRAVKPAHGTRGMPVWGWEFRAAEAADGARSQQDADAMIARLVEHVRSMQKE